MNILTHTIPDHLREKLYCGVEFFDTLTGGVTPSQLIMFSGAAGAGKTTALMQVADGFTKQGYTCVFVSAEQRADQVALMAERLNLKHGFNFMDINEFEAEGKSANERTEKKVRRIFEFVEDIERHSSGKNTILFVDSLTDLTEGNKDIVHAAKMFEGYCQEKAIVGFFMLHETKGGTFKGPTKLKHLLDSYFRLRHAGEGEPINAKYFEVLKNRFGAMNTVRTALIAGIGHVKEEKEVEVTDEDIIELM